MGLLLRRAELKNVGKTTHYVSQSRRPPRPWPARAADQLWPSTGAWVLSQFTRTRKIDERLQRTYVGGPAGPWRDRLAAARRGTSWHVHLGTGGRSGRCGTARQNTSAARRPAGLGITVIPHARGVGPQRSSFSNLRRAQLRTSRCWSVAVCARVAGNDEQPGLLAMVPGQQWGCGVWR